MKDYLLVLAMASNMLIATPLASQDRSGESPASADLSPAEAAMLKAARYARENLAVEGSYVWLYDAADPASRSGEGITSLNQGSTEPPGTPAVGLAFLEAYEATGQTYFLDAATETAMALVRTQLESGGWQWLLEFDPKAREAWCYLVDRTSGRPDCGMIVDNKKKDATSLDDNISQSALTFLMHTDIALGGGHAAIKEAVAYGLERFLEAQYPNGALPFRSDARIPDSLTKSAWRARFPESWSRTFVPPSGEVYITNDQLMRDVVRMFLAAHQLYREPAYLAAARRAGEFLLSAQLPAPQAGWAQVYNSDLEPIWGRPFEPPAIASRETAGAVEALIELYQATGERRYLEGAASAHDWLEQSRLDDGQWARFYELDSNRPLYFDQDYKLSYEGDAMPNHYVFVSDFGIPAVLDRYRRVAAGTPPDGKRVDKGRGGPDEGEVERIIGALDAEGRWVENGEIASGSFVRNMSRLAAHVARQRGRGLPDHIGFIEEMLDR